MHGLSSGGRVARRICQTWPVDSMIGLWLRRWVLRERASQPDDITVVIGVRNRSDYRLANALRSIQAQHDLPGAARALVVDYGSDPDEASRASKICRTYAADYLRVDSAPIWSRSRALNIGIRQARSKFVMVSDVDILLSPRYLADAIEALKAEPLSIVCSPMLDLPEASSTAFRELPGHDAPLPLDCWKERAVPRDLLDFTDFHPSIALTYTAFLDLIRGYDEYYEVWGCEDDDLMRRLHYLGLRPLKLDTGSFYLRGSRDCISPCAWRHIANTVFRRHGLHISASRVGAERLLAACARSEPSQRREPRTISCRTSPPRHPVPRGSVVPRSGPRGGGPPGAPSFAGRCAGR